MASRRPPRPWRSSRFDAGDAGRPGEIDDHARLARSEQAEAEALDDRLGAPALRPTDRRIELKIDLRHVDDDPGRVGEDVRVRRHRTGEIEGELRGLPIVGETRRDRDSAARRLGRLQARGRRTAPPSPQTPPADVGAASVLGSQRASLSAIVHERLMNYDAAAAKRRPVVRDATVTRPARRGEFACQPAVRRLCKDLSHLGRLRSLRR